MGTRHNRVARRIAIALSMTAGLGGCVYAPPYGVYDSYAYYPAYSYYYPGYSYYYPAYSYPTYVGPPIGLNFNFGYYNHGHGHGHHGHHGHHGNHGGYGHHGGSGHGRH